ncbi:MAG: ABC transporter substrate-binding protein [Armatimonadota bacterium]|nr:ABC transporter substrate-binding protein [Armatimonadota bacterium]
MRLRCLVAFTLFAILACTAAPALSREARLTFGFAGVKQLHYTATLIALDRLRDRGYEPVSVFFPRPELAAQALIRGEVDLARLDSITASNVIARGAQISMVAAPGLSEWVLVTPKTIATPQALARRRIAVHSVSSMSNGVVQYAIKKHRIADPQILIIPGSPARAQALLQGEIDATSLFLIDAIRLQMLAPDRFHILVDFKDLPVVDSVVVARREWLAGRQPEVQDFVRVLLETHRRITAGAEWAVARTLHLFPDQDPAFVAAAVRAYAARGIWDVNGGIGGLTKAPEMVRFLKTLEMLPASASENREDYTDLQHLQAVLARIGRK